MTSVPGFWNLHTYNRIKGSVPVSGQQSSMEEADNQ